MPLAGQNDVILLPFSVVSNQNVGFTGILIDSANESVAQVFLIRSSGTISKVGFRTVAVTTGAVLDVRLETVAGGNPSGTLVQSSANGLLTVTDTDDNTYFTVTLGSGVVVTAGTVMALRIQMNATSAGTLQLAKLDAAYDSNFSYSDNFQANAWTRNVTVMVAALEYTGGSYVLTDGIYPVQNYSTVAMTTASAVDERGVAFSVPYPCTLVGFAAHLDSDITSSGLLYDADTTTVLQRVLNIGSNNRSVVSPTWARYTFAAATTLLAASTYRLTFVPDPGGNVVVSQIIGSSTAVMNAFPHYPAWIETSRANSGGWTEDARSYPLISLLLSQFDDGTGASTTTLGQAAGVWGF